MIAQNEKHQHDYTKLGFLREVGVTDRSINRIILTRSCFCGDSQAFECGDRDEMRELLARIKSKETSQ